MKDFILKHYTAVSTELDKQVLQAVANDNYEQARNGYIAKKGVDQFVALLLSKLKEDDDG